MADKNSMYTHDIQKDTHAAGLDAFCFSADAVAAAAAAFAFSFSAFFSSLVLITRAGATAITCGRAAYQDSTARRSTAAGSSTQQQSCFGHA
jgi:hypothetical protein